jgi:DNA-directed RNA polymerase specialized sigma24 family protein
VARTLLLLAAVAAGYLVVYFVLKKKIARTLSAATVLREVREEVNRILVELNQTTHRNVTLLEDRIASLAEILARADKKIALARRETEKQELADRLYTELAGRRREGTAAATEAAGPATAPAPVSAVDRQAGRSPAEPASAAASMSAIDRQTEAVHLAQAGLSPSLIARRLGLTLGEVELILSLAERRR